MTTLAGHAALPASVSPPASLHVPSSPVHHAPSEADAAAALDWLMLSPSTDDKTFAGIFGNARAPDAQPLGLTAEQLAHLAAQFDLDLDAGDLPLFPAGDGMCAEEAAATRTATSADVVDVLSLTPGRQQISLADSTCVSASSYPSHPCASSSSSSSVSAFPSSCSSARTPAPLSAPAAAVSAQEGEKLGRRVATRAAARKAAAAVTATATAQSVSGGGNASHDNGAGGMVATTRGRRSLKAGDYANKDTVDKNNSHHQTLDFDNSRDHMAEEAAAQEEEEEDMVEEDHDDGDEEYYGEPTAKRSRRAVSKSYQPADRSRSPASSHGGRDPNHNARMARLNREKKKRYVMDLEKTVEDLRASLQAAQEREARSQRALAAAHTQVAQLQAALQAAPQLAALLKNMADTPGLVFSSAPGVSSDATQPVVVPIQINLAVTRP